ncbi:sulfite exporter TauE/SafE [Rhizobium sullae]|uniref:Probable membrane transporter protein n=1 Tax=Rhizobium sullae TaxID=50338 RepID=A0A4R3QHG1_RHISU|nr:sulfite exporter TauE/SafE [Rhizobium sullae]
MEGDRLIFLFGILMIVVGVLMLKPKKAMAVECRPVDLRMCLATAAVALAVGAASGFFGIGGGFLIVPGLMLATGMPRQVMVINVHFSSKWGSDPFYGKNPPPRTPRSRPEPNRTSSGCQSVHRRTNTLWYEVPMLLLTGGDPAMSNLALVEPRCSHGPNRFYLLHLRNFVAPHIFRPLHSCSELK